MQLGLHAGIDCGDGGCHSAAGTQGEGRYLIDKNPAKVISAGTLTGGTGPVGSGPGPVANFSGTELSGQRVSCNGADDHLAGKKHRAWNGDGGYCNERSHYGICDEYSSNSGTQRCGVRGDQPNSANPHNYEMATYSVVDGTHLQMTLNKVHRAGATIAFGGLCGYGLEQTVDTTGAIRQVFPVIGSISGTSLYYAGGLTSIVGLQGNTSAFLNVNLQIAAIARNNGTVTVTTAGNLPVDVNGLTMNVSGVTDQSYNGSFLVTSTGANTLTYVEAGANSTSTGGTVSKLTGGYVLYPMAEVMGVFDATAKSVDGQMTLAANTVPWGTNDSVEEPHYYQERVAADITFVGQATPRPTLSQSAGVQYEGNVGPGMSGWVVSNMAPTAELSGQRGYTFGTRSCLCLKGNLAAHDGRTGGGAERVLRALQLAWLWKVELGLQLV